MRKALTSVLLMSLVVLGHAQAAKEYQPEGSIREYFLGAWKLVSTEVKYPDGHSTPYPDLGPNAAGFLIYTPSGHMCAQLMKPGRPAWVDERHPTVAEAASALDGFVSYCGRFEIREAEKAVVHHPETAWAPNWVGTEQLRPYHLVDQNRFFFQVPSTEKQNDGTKVSVTRIITWERLT